MADSTLTTEERHALSTGRWFASLSPALRHDLLRNAEIQRFAHRQPVFVRGEPAMAWAGVARGIVRVSCHQVTGKQITLCCMRPGLWFSDVSVIEGGPRLYDAKAHGATTIVVVPRERVLSILSEHHALYDALLRLHAGRTRQAFELIEDLQTLPLRSRVAKQLVRMTRHYGTSVSDASKEIRINALLAQEELAHLVCASRQRLNSELRDMRLQGLIRLELGKVIVSNLAALERLGRGEVEDHPPLQMTGSALGRFTSATHRFAKVARP